jgi:hypothetical protein
VLEEHIVSGRLADIIALVIAAVIAADFTAYVIEAALVVIILRAAVLARRVPPVVENE